MSDKPEPQAQQTETPEIEPWDDDQARPTLFGASRYLEYLRKRKARQDAERAAAAKDEDGEAP